MSGGVFMGHGSVEVVKAGEWERCSGWRVSLLLEDHPCFAKARSKDGNRALSREPYLGMQAFVFHSATDDCPLAFREETPSLVRCRSDLNLNSGVSQQDQAFPSHKDAGKRQTCRS